MSHLGLAFPARLRAAGTELERELLRSARLEQPARELSERMASALGIAVSVLPAARRPVAKRSLFPAHITAFARARALWIIAVVLIVTAGGFGFWLYH